MSRRGHQCENEFFVINNFQLYGKMYYKIFISHLFGSDVQSTLIPQMHKKVYIVIKINTK